MGLTIHSLAEFPDNVERGYYIYLLETGWHTPVDQMLRDNFDKMADVASRNDAVVLRGTPGSHFNDDVLSWHHINGIDAAEILPAIMISRINPKRFQMPLEGKEYPKDARLVLLPLMKLCEDPTRLTPIIDRIFRDIVEKKFLSQFSVQKELHRGRSGAPLDALILEPNFAGLGIDLKAIF